MRATAVDIFPQYVRVAGHVRLARKGAASTTPGHRPPHHRRYRDGSPAHFERWAARLGPQTRAFIPAGLAHQKHPEQADRHAFGIIRLAQQPSVSTGDAAAASGRGRPPDLGRRGGAGAASGGSAAGGDPVAVREVLKLRRALDGEDGRRDVVHNDRPTVVVEVILKTCPAGRGGHQMKKVVFVGPGDLRGLLGGAYVHPKSSMTLVSTAVRLSCHVEDATLE